MHYYIIATLVCPGSNLTLTCLTNGPSLRWVITLPYHYLPEARIISSIGDAKSQTPLFEDPTLFSFLKTSTVPLMSTMLIDNISASLNGTHVDCWFDEGRSTTVIDVVGNGNLIIFSQHTVFYRSVNCLEKVREWHLSLSLYKLKAFMTCSITA